MLEALIQIAATPNINVLTQTEVTALDGDEVLREMTLRQRTTGQSRTLAASWLFVCISGEPQAQWMSQVGIVRDVGGYMVTGRLRTSAAISAGRSTSASARRISTPRGMCRAEWTRPPG
jgi:thioredoxin reductase